MTIADRYSLLGDLYLSISVTPHTSVNNLLTTSNTRHTHL